MTVDLVYWKFNSFHTYAIIVVWADQQRYLCVRKWHRSFCALVQNLVLEESQEKETVTVKYFQLTIF